MAFSGRDGDVLVNGLPLWGVYSALHGLQIVDAVVFAAVMLVAGTAAMIWIRLSLRPLRSIAGTARRVSELPLASDHVELRMLLHVGDALTRRQASERRMPTFAADVGHELRTPLTTVRAHLELVLRGEEPITPGLAHAPERIDAESSRMRTLVDCSASCSPLGKGAGLPYSRAAGIQERGRGKLAAHRAGEGDLPSSSDIDAGP
jgi:two-component system OmpR family sensor kinase